jgi:hypothetical protein
MFSHLSVAIAIAIVALAFAEDGSGGSSGVAPATSYASTVSSSETFVSFSHANIRPQYESGLFGVFVTLTTLFFAGALASAFLEGRKKDSEVCGCC